MATANDITAFPPEFLRKGRFDEVFFIDFPNEEERERIFEIHLEKRGKMSDDINLKELAEETEGYCGADIEEIVKNAVESKFVMETENEEDKKITTNDLLEATKNIDSLTNILADKIEVLKKSYKKFKIKSASQKIKNGKRITGRPTFKDMVIVRGGKYTPSFFNEEREVCDLEVCKYQTTQDMWMEVMKNNPSKFKGGRRPVENVSWWDALEFCNKLSKKYGLKPVYDLSRRKEGILRIYQLDGKVEYPNVANFKKTEGFRLPTEFEWEWFECGGEIAIQNDTFKKYLYSGSNNLDEVAWYTNIGMEFTSDSLTAVQTHDVGIKKPNQLGLYDCSGNVSEWCYDTTCEKKYLNEKNPYVYDETVKRRISKGSPWYGVVELKKNYKKTKESEEILNGKNEVFIQIGDCFDNGDKNSNCGFRIVRTI